MITGRVVQGVIQGLFQKWILMRQDPLHGEARSDECAVGEAGAAAPGRKGAWTATGAHHVPERYGSWETVYGLCRRWQRDGTWHRIFEQLQARADAEGLITWDVSVNSTIARAHQHAAGARKRGACRSSRPVASSPSPTTTGSDAPGAG